MSKAKSKSKARDEAWKRAKEICRLSVRHVEMARELGMNPDKLPGLRPSPKQRWKLPLPQFIEELYEKRFGERDAAPLPALGEKMAASPRREPRTGAPGGDRTQRALLEDAMLYLLNLSDDLQAQLSRRSIDPDLLPALVDELRALAEALTSGTSPGQMPSLLAPFPEPAGDLEPRAQRELSDETDGDGPPDDEIPF